MERREQLTRIAETVYVRQDSIDENLARITRLYEHLVTLEARDNPVQPITSRLTDKPARK